jgi:hypothetical protein
MTEMPLKNTKIATKLYTVITLPLNKHNLWKFCFLRGIKDPCEVISDFLRKSQNEKSEITSHG